MSVEYYAQVTWEAPIPDHREGRCPIPSSDLKILLGRGKSAPLLESILIQCIEFD